MSKFRLAEHQDYAVTMMTANRSLGIFYEAGTGKTMCALAWIYRALERGRIMRALVVCPASLTGSWATSIDKMLKFEGFTEEGVDRLRKAVTIVSYQRMYHSKRVEVRHRDGTVTRKRETSLRPEIDREWGAVIVDESHSIGKHDSLQTRVALKLAYLAKYRFIMSGTPVTGGKGREDFQKLYGQIKFLEPDAFRNWTEFKSRYVRSCDPWGNPVSYDEEACRDLMRRHGIVARLCDCYDMPDQTDTIVPCPLKCVREYKDMKEGNLEPYGMDLDVAGLQYQKMLQVCSGHIKNDDTYIRLDTSKDAALTDLLASSDGKVVVFCNYRASVDRVAELCRKAGRRTVVFDGRSKGETWRELQYGGADVLVAQYQSGGTGLDLFASHTMIFFEPHQSALIYGQARARIFRKGQEQKCSYYILTTPGTIEDRVWQTVMRGDEVTNAMLDEWSRE